MRFTVTSHAEKQIEKFPKTLQLIIISRIKKLAFEDTRRSEKLQEYRNLYRIRVGMVRIVYLKSPAEIEVILVAHRKEVYQLLQHVFK